MSPAENLQDKLPKQSQLQLFLFGPLRIEQNGEILAKPRQKVAALLTYLACNPGPHARAHLAELFWENIPPERFLPNLRSTLNRLPPVLKRYIVTTAQTVAFEPTDDLWIDLHLFQRLADYLPKADGSVPCNSGADLDQVASQLQTMKELYQGDLLEGLTLKDAPAFSQWLRIQRAALSRLALESMQHLAHLYQQQGRYREAIGCVQQMLDLNPSNEDAQSLLRFFSARATETESGGSNDQATEQEVNKKSILTAHNAESIIADDVETHLRKGTTTLLPPTNLPFLTESFVGRQAELAEVIHKLRSLNCRLLTIIGLGGVGKTYIAVEAARILACDHTFYHGVYFVPLEGVQSAERMPEAILQALNVVLPGQENLLDALCNYLATKEILFILDNFEHLLAKPVGNQPVALSAQAKPRTGIEIVAQLLQAAPNIKFAVTSRQPLRLQQEYLFPLTGLPSLPPDCSHALAELAQNDAVSLFLQVAERVSPAFQLTEANRQAILQFCRSVQGVPLAIVLGAAQMDFLTAQQLIKTYQESIDVLEIDWVDLPDRQQSIRALFDYSWQQLPPHLRQIFAQLTLFQGGFSRKAAQQIVGASLLQLKQLYHQSLLQQTAYDRYQIHELLRQLGAEKPKIQRSDVQRKERFSAEQVVDAQSESSASTALHERHMHFYLGWLAQQVDTLQGPNQHEAVTAIMLERNNLRQAWQHAVAGQHIALLTGALKSYQIFHEEQGLYQEQLAIVTDAIQAVEPTIQQYWMLDGAEERERCGQVIDRARPNKVERDRSYLEAYGLLLASQSDCFIAMGNPKRAIFNAKRLLACTKRFDESSPRRDALQAWGYRIWSRGLSMLGEDHAAHKLANRAIVAAQRTTDPTTIADGFHMRGNTHLLLAQIDAAETDFQQAHALFVQSQAQRKAMGIVERLGNLKLWAADLQAAKRYFEQAIAMSKELLDQPSGHRLRFNLSRITYKMGDYQSAEQTTYEALRYFEDIGDRWLATEAHYFLGKLYYSAGQYKRAEQHQAEALRISRAMRARRNQIICLTRLGVTLTRLGNYQHALDLMREAATIARELKIDPVHSNILICMADTLHHAGQPTKSLARYQEALTNYAASELGYQKVEVIVGLAHALYKSGNDTAAAGYLAELTTSIEVSSQEIHRLAEPFDLYLRYYHLLNAYQAQRAPALLERVHTLLQRWASQIDDEQWRKSLLENVTATQELIYLYQEQQRAATPPSNQRMPVDQAQYLVTSSAYRLDR